MKRNLFTKKLDGFIRYLMVHILSSKLPLFIVNEYPKSGGTWVSQMLSDYFEVPFPRNHIPGLCSSIMHGHYRYSSHLKNVFLVIRDGRDIMVSSYYHSFFENELYNTRFVEKNRRKVPFNDYENIEANMPLFIRYRFEQISYPRFNWRDFFEDWVDKDVAKIRYERLLTHCAGELAQAIRKVTGSEPDMTRLEKISDKYSFRRQAKREPGQELKISFLRKGIAGDWKNVFDQEAREIFNYYAGEQLIKLGYEQDDSWVH